MSTKKTVGRRPLHIAPEKDYLEIAKLLLGNGVDICNDELRSPIIRGHAVRATRAISRAASSGPSIASCQRLSCWAARR